MPTPHYNASGALVGWTDSKPKETTMIQFVACKSRKTAWRKCPWASFITKVEGGFMCYETVTDRATWRNQK